MILFQRSPPYKLSVETSTPYENFETYITKIITWLHGDFVMLIGKISFNFYRIENIASSSKKQLTVSRFFQGY